MPNPIKYTAGTETLALKKGNFYIGTGDVGKGPSDSTGYYQGPSPASGGYVIYLNKSGVPGDLSYHSAANDSQLISFTNNLSGTSFTSATQCLNYYATQTDKVCFNRDYEPIVTSGLTFNLDAGFTPSYSRSGTTWYDISGSNNGTLTNGPIFNSDNGGSIVFDGVDDYVDCGTDSQLTGILNVTACVWVNIISNTESSAIVNRYFNTTVNNGWALAGGGTSEPINFGFSGRESSAQFINIASDYKFYFNTWYYAVGVKEGNIWKIYVNGVLENSQQVGNGTTTFANNKTFLASYPQFAEPPNRNNNIKIANTQIYNRALSADEVLQNYNAQKGRFGL
jgi:hypothetical protein